MEDLPTFALMKVLIHPVLHSSDKVNLAQVCKRWHKLLSKRLKYHSQMAAVKEKSVWFLIQPWGNFEESIAENKLSPQEILLNSVGNKHKAQLSSLDIINVKLYVYNLYRAKHQMISFRITYCNGKEDHPFGNYFVPKHIFDQLVPIPSKKAPIYLSGPVVPITTPSEMKKNENVSVFYCYQYVIGKLRK